MKKIFLFLFLLIVIPFAYAATAHWVNDPANCPATDATEFPGQDCSPNNICGENSDIAQCHDGSSISAPSSAAISNIDQDGGSFDGGYLINCFVSADASAPFCDNSGSFWCDRNSTCYSIRFRSTTCTANVFGASTCGSCRSGYNDCNEDGGVCEIQNGASCGTNAEYNGCNGILGNCVCEANYLDCDASGASSGNGCEIGVGASCGSGTGTYASTCGGSSGNCTSTGTTLDCNNDDSDSNELTCNGADGCEITVGSACNVGSLSGTYANSCSGGTGLCVIDKSFFETGTQTNYSTDDPLLWGVQYGGGDLANFTNANSNVSFAINNSGCLVFPDGTTQCSGTVDTNISGLVPYENATQNVNLSSQNVTTAGTGFFGFLGSFLSRITGLFVQDINASGNIDVGGDVNISGNLQVTGNITGGSPVKVVGGLDVDGNTSLDGFVNVTGDLHMTNGSITHNSPVLIRDGLRLEDSLGTKYFDIEIEGISKHAETDAPDALNGSLIFETWNSTNPYNIQIAFWDYITHRPTLIIDTVSEERASVFDGSLLVGKALGNATVDANYTHCDGFNLIDCNTTGTGADLGVEDDLETKGSIHAQGDLTVDGNTTFGEKITFSLGETLENIIDGIIRLTGTLNITGNLSVGEGIELNGTTITDFSQISGLFESINNTTQLKASEPIALSDDLVLKDENTAIRNAENTTRAYISTEGIFTIEG